MTYAMADEEKITRVEFPQDPTKNVMDLVVARSQHLQDLINALEVRIDKTFSLRDALRTKEGVQILSDLDQIRREIREREVHSKDLAAKEKERLDAIREIDGNNLSAAVERAQTEAKMLAKAVEQAADARRVALAELSTHVDTRLGRLEVFQNEAKGRQGLSFPLTLMLGGAMGAVLGFLINLLYTAVSHFKG